MGCGKGRNRLIARSFVLTGAAAVLTGAAAAAGMAWAVRGRSSTVFGPSVWRGLPGRKAIALTFDDGPSPATLPILDILASYGVSATFFQCGENVLRAPELSRAVCAGPHELGNHSHTHPNFALTRPPYIVGEFLRAQNIIAEATSITPVLLRPPFGVRWFGFREMQEGLNLMSVMWSVIGLDWKLDAARIAERVLSRAGDGAIVCLHDGRGTLKDPDVSTTIEAVRRIVPSLLEKGYHFETVSQLVCPT
jgi:peptidoglycan/xylan/chitin deacetylase (PgdA/CDA1 family)